MLQRLGILLLVCGCLLTLPVGVRAAPVGASAEDGDETFKAAVRLLRAGTEVQRDGMQNAYLRALRHLRDPELAPLFRHLMNSDQPTFRVHGFLGLAECLPAHRLDLELLAKTKDPTLQAEMVSAALDAELVDAELAKQIIGWPDLDISAKVVVAAQLVKDKQPVDRDMLFQATVKGNLARTGLVAVLLTELDDPRAAGLLRAIDTSTDAHRDELREMMLQTAVRYEFARVGPWAMQTARSLGPESRVGLMGLRAALRFGQPEAPAWWREQFMSADGPAQHNRLALLALNVAPWADPALFEPLERSDEVLLKRIGVAGAAIAAKKNVAPAVVDLIGLHHPMANLWCLAYAKLYASEADAPAILLALVKAYNPESNSATADLDNTVSAAEFLYERSPAAAGEMLRPILADHQTDTDLVRGILLGLLRCRGTQAYAVCAGLPPLGTANADGLALLLLTKTDQPMNPQQMRDLMLLIRGGADIPDVLRVQAAWFYLKRTGQVQAALAKVLAP
jgi:hypothetical protein